MPPALDTLTPEQLDQSSIADFDGMPLEPGDVEPPTFSPAWARNVNRLIGGGIA
jgi:hypothetical protein